MVTEPALERYVNSFLIFALLNCLPLVQASSLASEVGEAKAQARTLAPVLSRPNGNV